MANETITVLPFVPTISSGDQMVVDDGTTTRATPAPVPYPNTRPVLNSELVDPSWMESTFYLTDGTIRLSDSGSTSLCGGTDTLRQVNRTCWGACQQTLNNELFFYAQSYDFRPEKMVQNMIDSGMTWMRDFISAKQKSSNYGTIVPYYGGGYELVPPGPEIIASTNEARNLVHSWYDMYDRAGLSVSLCAHASVQLGNGGHTAINDSFLEFIIDMVQMHPCIKVIELHNEANLSTFWSKTDLEYIELYRDFAVRLKAQCPHVKIAWSGPSVMWWDDAMEVIDTYMANGMLDVVDAIAVHPYRASGGEMAPPELEPFYQAVSGEGAQSHAQFENGDWYETAVVAYHDYISALKPDLPIYYTEIGYSSGSGGSLTVGNEEAQAAYASRLFLMDMDLNLRYSNDMTGGAPVEATCWYQFTNSGTGSSQERALGWIYYDHVRKKPVFFVVKAIFDYFDDFDDLVPQDITVTPDINTTACKFKVWKRTSTGALIVAFWRLDQVAAVTADFDADITFASDFTVGSVRKFQPGINIDSPETISFTQVSDDVTVTVPVSWRAQWVELLV